MHAVGTALYIRIVSLKCEGKNNTKKLVVLTNDSTFFLFYVSLCLYIHTALYIFIFYTCSYWHIVSNGIWSWSQEILVVGCGNSNLPLDLAQQGFSVVGMDYSKCLGHRCERTENP